MMLNERLKSLRLKEGYTQKDVASKIHVSQQAYAKYENGTARPSPETLKSLADIFDVSTDFILGHKPVGSQPTGYIRVPVVGNVAAGIPIDAIEDVLDWEDVPESLAEGCELFGLKVKGDSMEPKISDGDVVIVRQCEDVETGNIAVVLINGDAATVKRIKKTPDGVMLVPNNPAYEPYFFTNKQIEELPVRIVGRVVELRAKM